MKSLKKLITLIVILISTVSFSQEIQFGEKQYFKTGVRGIYNISGDSFYVLTSDDFTGMTGILKFYENIKAEPKESKIKFVSSADKKKGKLIDMLVVNGKILSIFSVEKDETFAIYAQEYDNDCLPVGESRMICTFPSNNSIGLNQNDFKIKQSANKKYLALFLDFSNNKTENFFIGYKVFDNVLNLVQEGERNIPNKNKYYSIDSYNVSDYGNVTIRPQLVDRNSSPSTISYNLVWYGSQNKLEEFAISLNDAPIMFFTIFDNGGSSPICIGLSSMPEKKDGVFYSKIQPDGTLSEIVLSEIKNMAKYTPEITEIHLLENGDFLLFYESYNYKTIKSTSSNVAGIQYETRFYFKNISGIRLNSTGELIWHNSFGHANQIQFPNRFNQNYIGVLGENEYTMYLNGNVNKSGMEEEAEFTVSGVNTDLKKDNCLAKTVIDIKTGTFKRENINTDLTTGKLFLAPRSSTINYETKNLILDFVVGNGSFFSNFAIVKF